MLKFLQQRWIWLLSLSILSLLAGCNQINKLVGTQEEKIPEVPAEAHTTAQGPTRVALTPAQEQQIGLKTETVQVQPFPLKVKSTGQVQAAADLQAHIAPPVPGKVTTIYADLGQHVSRGQALTLIKSDAVGQTESDLLQAALQNESDIEQARVQLNFSQVAYQRELKLYNDRISAKADLETAGTQFEKDRANLQALKSKQEATIVTAQERLSLSGVAEGVAAEVVRQHHINPFITVSAPRDGIIISRSINIGELADPSKELFTVADLSRVWLVGDIYEQDITKVHLNQPVELTLDSRPGKVFPGRISYVGNILDPQARTLPIRADIPNPDLNLKPAMFARLSVLVGDQEILSIPHSAVQRRGKYAYVYVSVGDHTYEERQVTVGVDNGESVQILHGLNAGEQVVTQGALALEGAALKLMGS